MSILPEHLRAITYFQDLDSQALDRIRASVFEVQLENGQVLFSEGEPADAMTCPCTGVGAG